MVGVQTSLSGAETLLAEYIAYPTVSSDSNLVMIDALANRLADAGARVHLQHDATGAKANLFASLGPETDTGGLVLSGHTDVVPVTDQDWSSDPFAMDLRGDRLYGRGACDMKGFIAVAMDALVRVRSDALTAPLHFAFTYDEEVGCIGAKALAQDLRARGLRPDMALVGEPTSMKMVDGHKGCCQVRVDVMGREGHGSRPELCVNAVEYAMELATHLIGLGPALQARAPADCPFTPPYSTVHVGRLAGGTAFNVIPPKAVLDWEMRPISRDDRDFVMAEAERFIAEDLIPRMTTRAPEAGMSMAVAGEIDALKPTVQNRLRDRIGALTGQNSAGTVAFGTEAGSFQDLGMDVVVCGPGSIEQAHKPDEYVDRAQLAACSNLIDGLIADLLVA